MLHSTNAFRTEESDGGVMQPDHGRTIIITTTTTSSSSCSSEDLRQLLFQIITPTLGRSPMTQEFSKLTYSIVQSLS